MIWHRQIKQITQTAGHLNTVVIKARDRPFGEASVELDDGSVQTEKSIATPPKHVTKWLALAIFLPSLVEDSGHQQRVHGQNASS